MSTYWSDILIKDIPIEIKCVKIVKHRRIIHSYNLIMVDLSGKYGVRTKILKQKEFDAELRKDGFIDVYYTKDELNLLKLKS